MTNSIRKRIRGKEPRELRSVIVSYCFVDIPLYTSRTGYGETFKDAVSDADRQLSDGTWRRLTVSSVTSITRDLKGGSRMRRGRSVGSTYEGVVLRVEKNVTEVIDV